MEKKAKNFKKVKIFVVFLLVLAVAVSSGVYYFLKVNKQRDRISEKAYIEDGKVNN